VKLVSSILLIFVSLMLIGCSSGRSNIPAFTKHVDVFGIHIYATASAPDNKMLHAANVLAQYLDNDKDGVPDNQLVVDALKEKKAVLIMTKDAGEEWELIQEDLHYMFPDGVYHDNFANEANPNAVAEGKFDGLWEETLHLITRHGYGNAYSSVFGYSKGTEVANAMDLARGGHFEKIPEKYPEDAWYSYYDESCGYGCQIDEYIYWALTSILGVQDLPGREEQIITEWRLNSREKVLENDPAIFALLTNPDYKFPTVIPDGDYNAKTFAIENCLLEVKVQENNYIPPKGRYQATVSFITECQAPGGEAIKTAFTISENSEYKGKKLCLVTSTDEKNTIHSTAGDRVWLTTEPMIGRTGSVFPKIVKIEPIDN